MPLLKYVSIAFSGAFLTSIGNYAFNLIMARLLSSENLGIFQSFNSIFTILGVITTVISFRIMNLTSEYSATNDTLSIRNLFKFSTNEFRKLGIFLGIFMICISPLLKWFLHIDSYVPLLLTAIGVPGLILVNNARGFLQGLLLFKDNSINLVVEVVIKIITGVILIYCGLTYNAPILAMIAATYSAYILIHQLLKKRTTVTTTQQKQPIQRQQISWKTFLQYTFPTLIATGGIALFYTIDILLVRHYYGETNPEMVGAYATLSLLGKIIFFGSNSIAMTIFPVASKEHAKGIFPIHILKQGLVLTTLLGIGISVVYFLFPNLIVRTLFGEKYLSIAPLLGLFSIASASLSIMNVFTNFYLSTKKRLIIAVPLIGILIFVVSTIMRHETLDAIVYNLIGASVLSIVMYGTYVLFIEKFEKRFYHTQPQ